MRIRHEAACDDACRVQVIFTDHKLNIINQEGVAWYFAYPGQQLPGLCRRDCRRIDPEDRKPIGTR